MTSSHISPLLSFVHFYFTRFLFPESNKTWIVFWIINFFFLIEAEFPNFHSYLNFQFFRGAWLVFCTSWQPLFQVYPVFPVVLSLFQLCRASHTPLIFFALCASVWAWCNPSHLMSFDLHQIDPCRNSWECPARPGHPLSPLLHPLIFCWASLLFPSNLSPRAKIYWRASVVKSGEYIFILIEIKLWLELHF